MPSIRFDNTAYGKDAHSYFGSPNENAGAFYWRTAKWNQAQARNSKMSTDAWADRLVKANPSPNTKIVLRFRPDSPTEPGNEAGFERARKTCAKLNLQPTIL